MSEPAVPLSSLPEPAVVFDADGRVVARNDAAATCAHLLETEGSKRLVAEAAALGVARARWTELTEPRAWSVSASRLASGEVLVMLSERRGAEAERMAELGPLVHDLRNLAFGLALSVEGLAEAEPKEREDATRAITLTSRRLGAVVRAIDAWMTRG